MATTRDKVLFAICIDDTDADDLEKGKVYRLVPDSDAKKSNYVRVIDDSGDDYLYPESYFVSIKLPSEVEEALFA